MSLKMCDDADGWNKYYQELHEASKAQTPDTVQSDKAAEPVPAQSAADLQTRPERGTVTEVKDPQAAEPQATDPEPQAQSSGGTAESAQTKVDEDWSDQGGHRPDGGAGGGGAGARKRHPQGGTTPPGGGPLLLQRQAGDLRAGAGLAFGQSHTPHHRSMPSFVSPLYICICIHYVRVSIRIDTLT